MTIDFSSGIPLLQQLVPSLPDGTLRLLNRASLLAAVFLAAAGWEVLGLRGKLQWLFAALSKLKGWAFVRAMPERGYFFLAIAALVFVLFSDYSLFHWLSYPFMQYWNALVERRQFGVHPQWIAPVKSLGYLLWAFLSYFLIFVLGLGSVLRTAGHAAAFIGRRISERAYKGWLGFCTLVVAIVALITT